VIVIDASAVLELLLQTPPGNLVEARVFSRGETLHAPHLIDLEVAQVLRRYATLGDMDPFRGQQALEDLADLPLTRYPHRLFLPRIWTLRDNLTAYDAAYTALSESLPAPLLTRDRRLATAPGHSAVVELI
jgi:predicted nucleic acid-binding protein